MRVPIYPWLGGALALSEATDSRDKHVVSLPIIPPFLLACTGTSSCHPLALPDGNRQTFSDISESSPPRSASASVSGGHGPGKVATGTRNQKDVTLAGSTIVLPRATGLSASASDRDAQATAEGSHFEAASGSTTSLLMPRAAVTMPRALRRDGAHSASAIVRVRVPVYDTGHTATMASPQASTSSGIVCEGALLWTPRTASCTKHRGTYNFWSCFCG